MTDPVRIPGASVDPKGDNVAAPAISLLTQFELLPEESDAGEDKVGVVTGTPYSLQVISAGALAVNKWAIAAIAALGGGSAILAAGTRFWESETNPAVRAAIIAGFAVFLAALGIAIALIVRGDAFARAEASSAQFAARAEVVSAYFALVGTTLEAAESPKESNEEADSVLLPLLASHRGLRVTGEGFVDAPVSGVQVNGGKPQIRLGAAWHSVDKVESFSLERT